jgi:hypothetical protein
MTIEPKIWVERVKYTTRGGALVVYKTNGVMPDKAGKKKSITEFSEKSRKKLAFCASNAGCPWLSMITLTYARNYPRSGRAVKKHLNTFLVQLRKVIGNCKYLWFLEFQKRGAPHFHILLSVGYDIVAHSKLDLAWIRCSVSESDFSDEKYLRYVFWFNGPKRKVQGCNGCQFWQDAKSPEGLSHYAVKYASKMEQKDCPLNYLSVGRFWGCSRNLIVYEKEEIYGEFAEQPSARDLFPGKPLSGLPKYIFGN